MQEAQQLERRLNETLKTQNGVDRDEIESLRNRLRDEYEMVLTTETKVAVRENIEAKLWNSCFYNFIQELRKNQASDPQSAAELKRYLEEGTGFYHHLLRKLKPLFDSNRIILEPDEAERICCHNCLVYLGDLARYSQTYFKGNNWSIPGEYYQQSILLCPNEGRPHSQLAIIASQEKQDLQVVYQYCMSLATKKAFVLARKNLLVYYNSRKERHNPDTGSNFSEVFLNFHQLATTTRENKLANLVEYYFKILEFFQQDLLNGLESSTIRQALIIAIFSAHDSVHKEDDPRINDLFVSLIFDLINIIIVAIIQASTTSPNSNSTHNLSISNLKIRLYPALKLFSDWLVSNPKILTHHDAFDPLFSGHPSANMHFPKQKFWENLRDLLNMTTRNSEEKTMWNENQPLQEDLEVLGFLPLLPTQSSLVLAQATIVSGLPVPLDISPANTDELRERVQLKAFDRLAKLAVANRLIFFHESSQSYSLEENPNEDEKLRERREKGMKMMAQARLKEVVESLESNLSNLKSPQNENLTMIYVLDTSTFLYFLSDIKTILAAEKHLLIVPLYVISKLDELKKGTEKVNGAARESIRFLEETFRSNSHNIRSQSAEETVSESIEITDVTGFKKSEIKQMSGCCLYFIRKYGVERFFLLLGDNSFEPVAIQAGIPFQKIEVVARNSFSKKATGSGNNKGERSPGKHSRSYQSNRRNKDD